MFKRVIKKADKVFGKNRMAYLKDQLTKDFKDGHAPASVIDTVNNGSEVKIDGWILGQPLCNLLYKSIKVWLGDWYIGTVYIDKSVLEDIEKVKEDD